MSVTKDQVFEFIDKTDETAYFEIRVEGIGYGVHTESVFDGITQP